MASLSVAIICSNNEDTIEMVLESVKNIADEIVVLVDRKSTDRTEEICWKYTDLVRLESWRGFAGQKNEALRLCTCDWILSLDSDEVLTPALAEEIQLIKESSVFDGYFLKRRTNYIDKLMQYAWLPDKRLRLVKKNASPTWGDVTVHEVLTIKGSTAELKGYVDHYSYKDIDDHMRRTVHYARCVALEKFKAGKKFKLFKAITDPGFSFFKQYILKRAIFDGYRGFLAAISAGLYAFLKNAFLWELHYRAKKKE